MFSPRVVDPRFHRTKSVLSMLRRAKSCLQEKLAVWKSEDTTFAQDTLMIRRPRAKLSTRTVGWIPVMRDILILMASYMCLIGVSTEQSSS